MKSLINYFNKEDKYILFVYFYLFVMPWNFFKWQMGVFSIILFVWWLFRYKNDLKCKIKSIFKFKPLLVFLIFLLYVYITPFWSDSWKEGFEYVNDKYKYYIFVIPVLFTSLDDFQAKRALKILIFSFISYAIFSICIYLGFFTIEHTGSNMMNPKGIMGYAIVSIYMAVAAISSFIIAMSYNNKVYRLLFFIFAFICFFALMVNNSRTSQLAFFLSIIFLLFIIYNKNIFKIKNFLICATLLFILSATTIYLLNKTDKINRFTSAYKETSLALEKNKFKGSVGYRLYFNILGVEIIRDNNIIFGMGPVDNTKEFTERLKSDARWTSDLVFTAFHNTHLDLITRYGFLGYFLLIGSIIYLLISFKNKDLYFYIGLAFFSIIFFCSFANGTFEKKPINYLIITFFILLSIISSSKNKRISDGN